MMPAQFPIDLFGELRLLLGAYDPVVLKQVLDELRGLSRESGRTGAAARLGLSLAGKCAVADPRDQQGPVDEQIIQYAVQNRCLVVTNDRKMRDALFARGIGVISMRKQKKLELLRR